MKITEIEAKGILNPVKQPDDWFGLKYNMNLYRGCQHRCIYCDSRSECYQIEDFDNEIIVKTNAPDLLADQLPRKRVKGTIGTGSMNDPYMPIEKQYNLTGRSLEAIAANQFPVHVLTKSDLVLKDIDTLAEIAKVFAAVSFTVTTADDALAKKLEPGAPLVSRRFAAMRALANSGIHTGVLLMPLLPFIEDQPENIRNIVAKTAANGGTYIIPAFGVTLRDRQRDYFYDQLDKHFPGMKEQYIEKFGTRYHAPANNADHLYKVLEKSCAAHKIELKMPTFTPEKIIKQSQQLRMF